MFFPKSFNLMACNSNLNCSDHGTCENGVCVCQVQFSGYTCKDANVGYIAAFSSIFSTVVLISIVQLVICIYSEYKKLKHPNVLSAFRVTTQKLLHGVVIIASLTRVLYFSLQGVIPDQWLIPIESAYHPFLITGLSLVACYWSEAFFIETASVDASRRAQFLSKSLAAFSIFNIILYILLIAQFVVTGVGCCNSGSEELWINGAFQASFAILLFVVYVIFLAIGVEIFFKVRGAFTLGNSNIQSSSSNCQETVNKSEVFKSRIALIFQALLTLLTVLCVVFDAAGNLWKYRVNSSTRSTHEIIYRIAEVGAVLWFPCVLWNTAEPEALWFLNPRCLLKLTTDAGERLLSSPSRRTNKSYQTFVEEESDLVQEVTGPGECWICYDPERTDAGEFIRPCLCKGGMAQVHHECLKKWLVQHPNVEDACCKVCKHRYTIEQKRMRFGALILSSKRASSLIIPAIVVAVVAPCSSVLVFLLCDYLETPVKVLVLGATVLAELIAFKILGVNFTKLYQITRLSALRILNYHHSKTDIKNNEHTVVDVQYDVIEGDDTPARDAIVDPGLRVM
uniref:Uncharacterized protein LOC100176980 n=1 Tax=Phallusia mammillata TaxID=59560 RepID=A0A6F9DH43_9ASCI|nr:uncharacterized protein LOC100176980 [Phallusia mammillata]